MDRFTQMDLFVQVAELASITRAAALLGLSDSVASRAISALEARLGVRLLERTTRRLWLTEAGQAYYERCAKLMADMAEADAMVDQYSTHPSGQLSLTASPSFAMMYIAPLLPEFRRLYPDLTIRILAANHYEDAIDPGIDLAIRTREYEPDSGITIRKLAQARYVPVASPHYITEHGTPTTPADLVRHRVLMYSVSKESPPITFSKDENKESVRVKPVLTSTEGRVLCSAALAGEGIAIQPMFTLYDDVQAGRLVPLLRDWALPHVTVNLAFHTRRHQPAKIKVFADFLTAQFLQHEFGRKWME
ncbi:LysR family transcriptional regulator [Paraburkholderia dipogonis]|uniref:LysR family transcriptional regulator n=1 Tax=Paraburkholderia dipogonis TaxID=1211383 RepID=A0A4Y8MKU4_9BURK|nr:LysR family transcriptional regulator [Paraburkholderia dipogonis]TFE38077.1 LysR family transcriptional regulator [Paraburkholderia dipogonis]